MWSRRSCVRTTEPRPQFRCGYGSAVEDYFPDDVRPVDPRTLPHFVRNLTDMSLARHTEQTSPNLPAEGAMVIIPFSLDCARIESLAVKHDIILENSLYLECQSVFVYKMLFQCNGKHVSLVWMERRV